MKRKLIISTVLLALFLVVLQLTFYTPKYIYRVLVWQEPSYDYYKKSESLTIEKAIETFYFAKGTAKQESEAISKLENQTAIDALDTFMKKTKTLSFLVIQNDSLILEKYYQNETRASLQASFSVTKSIVSMLVGIAIEDKSIQSLDDPITKYLPELEVRDGGFKNVTIGELLSMKSGIKFSNNINFPFVNCDNPKAFYHPDLRRVALNHTELEDDLEGKFKYNDYNALLVGLIIERATGIGVSDYFQSKIWNKIGTEFDASWSIDDHNFEKTESGFNASPIDMAKIGRLVLNNGSWNSRQLIAKDWIVNSTQPIPGDYEYGNPHKWTYKYYWWSIPEEDGKSDFMAIGLYGQFIYVSPDSNTIIVRNGEKLDNFDDDDWTEIFYTFAKSEK